MSSLYVLKGRDQGKRFELGDSVVSIGREAGNTIRLRDTEVSRRHGEIRREGDQWVLVDLASSNGSYVERERVTRRLLKTGDRIQIGGTWLLYTLSDAPGVGSGRSQVDIVEHDSSADASHIVARSDRPSAAMLSLESEVGWGAEARSDLAVLFRTAQAVSHTLDIEQLCHRLLELIFEAIPADRGCMLLVDSNNSALVPHAVRHRRDNESDRIAISQSILDYVTQHGEGVLTRDARADERWDTGASIVREGIREAICVPMQGRYGTVGVIYVDTKVKELAIEDAAAHRRFRDDQLKLMVAIGHQAALAVEDTSYYSALVQSERLAAVGQTVATLSHHIKNILQGLKGGGFLIQEGIRRKDDEAIGKGWKMVERNQERIQHLVMDMLTFSKERSPDLYATDLDAVVDEVVELMTHPASEQKIKLVRDRHLAIPQLMLDGEGMHRAILNLVTNAIDACAGRESGTVLIATDWDPTERRATVSVADDGVGIAADEFEKIFRPFESTKGNRGTGLGLPATRKIVREHGGDVTVESRIDHGSCFTISLPNATLAGTTPNDDAGPATIMFEI